jgi:hypothetical protein
VLVKHSVASSGDLQTSIHEGVKMNYRLQLSPISGVRESQIEFPFAQSVNLESQTAKWRDAEFLRSWLVYDSECADNGHSYNWNALLGLGLAVCVSIACWVGLGMMLTRLLK